MDITTSVTHISLCSGYGGIDEGLRRAIKGLRTIAYCEIEAFVCANVVAKMEQGLMDCAPIWTNLKTFPWECFRDKVGILSGGFPCFAAGTFVLSERGYIPIETIRVGDRVLTHLGRWKRVTSVMVRENASLRKVDGQGIPGLITTDEHPFYARRCKRTGFTENGKRGSRRTYSSPEWINAEDMRGKYAAQVLPFMERKNAVPGDAAFWWLVGWYIAEGWRVRRKGRKNAGRVVLCCGKPETEMLRDRIKDAGFNASRSDERTGVKFHITKNSFYRFLKQFGKGAGGKRLPGFVFQLDDDRSKSFLEGYLAGDGGKEKSGERRANTVSKALALSIALLAQRVYGVVASVRVNRKARRTRIEGREVNQQDYWTVGIPVHNSSAFVDGNYGWKFIRKSGPCGNGRVWNLSVQDDESYVADGAIVHNCQPFSSAGSRNADGDPRHLFPYIRHGIEIMRPDCVFLENVEGIVSAKLAGDGWNDPSGTPVLLHVIRELERLDYTAEAGVFSASECEAPHQRKRLFILAVANSAVRRYTISGLWNSEFRASAETGLLCRSGDSSRNAESEKPKLADSGLFGRQGSEQQTAGSVESGQEPGCEHRGKCLSRFQFWPSRPGESQSLWEPPRVVFDRSKIVADAPELHGNDGGNIPGIILEGQPVSESGNGSGERGIPAATEEKLADSDNGGDGRNSGTLGQETGTESGSGNIPDEIPGSGSDQGGTERNLADSECHGSEQHGREECDNQRKGQDSEGIGPELCDDPGRQGGIGTSGKSELADTESGESGEPAERERREDSGRGSEEGTVEHPVSGGSHDGCLVRGTVNEGKGSGIATADNGSEIASPGGSGCEKDLVYSDGLRRQDIGGELEKTEGEIRNNEAGGTVLAGSGESCGESGTADSAGMSLPDTGRVDPAAIQSPCIPDGSEDVVDSDDNGHGGESRPDLPAEPAKPATHRPSASRAWAELVNSNRHGHGGHSESEKTESVGGTETPAVCNGEKSELADSDSRGLEGTGEKGREGRSGDVVCESTGPAELADSDGVRLSGTAEVGKLAGPGLGIDRENGGREMADSDDLRQSSENPAQGTQGRGPAESGSRSGEEGNLVYSDGPVGFNGTGGNEKPDGGQPGDAVSSPSQDSGTEHETGKSEVECPMGGDFDGLADGMGGPVGSCFSDQELDEICQYMSHVTSRVDELRLLGNGVVPAVAARAWGHLAGRFVSGHEIHCPDTGDIEETDNEPEVVEGAGDESGSEE